MFKSLISYGPHFGHVEQFGSNGYTDQSRTMPLVDDYNGFTAQLWVSPVAALTWLNSFSYAYRHGYYGRKSPYTITYSGHTSRSYAFQSQLMLRLSSSRHTLSADVSVENLENRQSVYREMKNESGASYYEYYTPVRTGNRLWMEGQVSYTADLGVRGELPCWTVQAALQWYHRHQTAYLYPYYRRQRIGNRDYCLSVERNFPLWPTTARLPSPARSRSFRPRWRRSSAVSTSILLHRAIQWEAVAAMLSSCRASSSARTSNFLSTKGKQTKHSTTAKAATTPRFR